MADCGAFSYIDQPLPSYSTADVLKIYSELDFNYGVSVDHLVVPKFKDMAQERMEITYNNGREAFSLWKKKYKEDFQLIVAVQGQEVPDYIRMFNDFYKHGIRTFAFGGLVRSQTSFILDLAAALIHDIKTTGKKPDYIHFFGLARCSLFPKFKEMEELGIDVAFDSASYLRKAWLAAPSSEANYIAPDWQGYTAIRIPQKPRQLEGHLVDQDEYLQMTDLCLKLLWDYDSGLIEPEKVLEVLKTFNEMSGERPDLITYYTRTLKNKPWKSCLCPICKDIGIDIAIFRGNNRNRRRGFHNTKMFYNILKDESKWERCIKKEIPKNEKKISQENSSNKQKFSPEITEILPVKSQIIKENRVIQQEKTLDFLQNETNVLIITGCTKRKLGCDKRVKAPAKDMYQGTLFKKVRQYAEIMKFQYLIISAKYGLLHPDDEIEGYNAVLKTKQDIERIRPGVEKELKTTLSSYNGIVVIAGEKYRRVLVNLLDDRFVFIKSVGIGDLVSIVGKAIPGKNRNLDDF